jgi:hypothetical protein
MVANADRVRSGDYRLGGTGGGPSAVMAFCWVRTAVVTAELKVASAALMAAVFVLARALP